MGRKIEDKTAGVRCAGCGHSESEHARNGARPCLAAVGELLERELCNCEEFRVGAAMAA